MSEFNWSTMEVVNANDRFKVAPKLEPTIDEVISKIVGKKIFQHDPRLLKLICKWKRNKPENAMEPDNFLQDPVKIKELREVLNGNL